MQATVAFHEFDFDEPYASGPRDLTPGEAHALNISRKEKLAAQIRKQVEEANDAAKTAGASVSDETLAKLQAALNAAASAFAFEVGGPSEPALSPEEREAMAIARAFLSDMLRAAGLTAKAYKDKNGEDYVKAKLDSIATSPKIVAEAKKRVALRNRLVNDEENAMTL